MRFRNKKIVVPANVCPAVVSAVMLSGNLPYFVDINGDFSIDPNCLKGIGAKGVAGVIFPYMYGNTGNIERVLNISRRKGWFVLEDVAQALGARIGSSYAGSFSDFSITSFGIGKIIDVNKGGVLCTHDKAIFKKAGKAYEKLPVMDTDLDFLPRLEGKLRRLEEELGIRRSNAMVFQSALRDSKVRPLQHNKGATYWRQNILVGKDRDSLLRYLKENGVKASKYFPSIDKLFCPRGRRTFKQSDLMAERIINLWPGRETKRGDILKIRDLIDRFYAKG